MGKNGFYIVDFEILLFTWSQSRCCFNPFTIYKCIQLYTRYLALSSQWGNARATGYVIAPNVVIVKFFNFRAKIFWHGDFISKGKKKGSKMVPYLVFN
jgi:hypothetical protein